LALSQLMLPKQIIKFTSYFFLFQLLAFAACNNKSDCCAQPPSVKPTTVSIGLVGDAADVQTTTQAGTVLMGGGSDVDEAIQWMIGRSGGGDFVVIRATGSTGYNEYIKGLGMVNSVETLLIDSKEKANLKEAGEKIRNAEALFIAGGDQNNYVQFWTDTEVSKAIQYLIDTKKVPIGGTSAGCAILSGYIFDAKNGSVISEEALTNPYNPLVSLSKSFIKIPALQNTIADQHYSQRTRQGRHVAFLARLMKDFNATAPLGIGVDEKTAVAIDEDGATRTFGAGNAHFLLTSKTPEQCEANKTLTWNRDGKAVSTSIKKGSPIGTEGFNVLQKTTAVADQFWYATDGVFKIN
jgi:cyanophycinase